MATFTMRLETVDQPQPQPASTPAPASSRPPQRLKILLVEDDLNTSMVMARVLRSLGHEVATADTARAALELSDSRPFDLVISDLGLPDISGHDLMRQLQDRHPLKGIAVSGYGTEEDIRRSYEVGFIEHVTKPIDLSQLEAAIQHAVA